MDFKAEFPRRSRSRNLLSATLFCIVLSSVFFLTHSRQAAGADLSCYVNPLEEDTKPMGTSGRAHSHAEILSSTPGGARFRDSLVNGTRYVTTWMDAGWTNNFMTIVNMVYLSTLTDRVPVLPAFMPLHVGADAPPIPFGEVFDVPRLVEVLRRPILEWHELKDPASTELEPIGCWSVWEAVSEGDGPRPSLAPNVLNLDVSYTRAPDWISLNRNTHTTFWKLAKMSYPEGQEGYNSPARPSPQLHATLRPDDQMMCFDFLYYVAAEDVFEWERSFSPAWRTIATHLHWTDRVEAIAMSYLREILSVHSDGLIPAYIALHIRHGDFSGWCDSLDPLTQCFAPLAVWEKYVEQLRAELRETKGIVGPIPVIVTSDERKQSWWDEVESLGWHRTDHEGMETAAQYGKWYAVFIDAVIQASATGFLGTKDSTMSLLALRRVQDWQGGIGHMVEWNSYNNHPEAIKISRRDMQDFEGPVFDEGLL